MFVLLGLERLSIFVVVIFCNVGGIFGWNILIRVNVESGLLNRVRFDVSLLISFWLIIFVVLSMSICIWFGFFYLVFVFCF